jgi:ankyrin repeat protein
MSSTRNRKTQGQLRKRKVPISNASHLSVEVQSSSALNATELMRAVTKDDILTIARLLNDSEVLKSLFTMDNKGRTALDWARICHNYEAVTIILKAMSTQLSNARVNRLVNSLDDFDGYVKRVNNLQGKQLQKALADRNAELAVRLLHECPLTRNEVESLGETYFCDWSGAVGYTPLILAAGLNMRNVVQELVRLKIPLEAENKFGHTALTIAASAGNADIVHFLLFSGADIHHRTEEGRTALHFACMYAKAKIVSTILDFMLERFAIFRIQGHALIDFDFTRWTTYCSIFESLINVGNVN